MQVSGIVPEVASALQTRPDRGLLSLPVAADKIIGLAEITELFGVTKPTALRYTHRRDFPKPVATLESGRIWERRKVIAWGKRMLPLQEGRPPNKPR